ncbi:MAG: aminopeptidase P N-terminal domain-containing protein [Flavobacteriales bacterium]
MQKFLLVSFACAFGVNSLIAQSDSSMVSKPEFQIAHLPEIDELTAEFFTANRKKMRDTLPDSSMAVIFSASVKARSNDIDFPFHQDPDFYYFTGVREPDAMLVLFKEPIMVDKRQISEILFVEDKSDSKERWTGRMLGMDGAKRISGIETVLPNTDFKPMEFPWDRILKVYANKHQDIERDDVTHPGDLMSLSKHFKLKLNRAGLTAKVNEFEDLIAFLRQRKSEQEIMMLQRAIEITCEAQRNAMQSIKAGMTEYQVEALIEYTFRANGADGAAFPSIVAAGRNGAIMHYTSNNSLLFPGDLVVMDIGAQYEGYAADVTRTVPIDGKFTEEQAAIYQIVLDAQTVAARYATPGYKFWTPHEEAYRTIGKGLIKLGIITEWSEIGNYFIHGTSHYLGLDVHDAGLYTSLKPGDVITVEPGIYIPEGSPCDPKWWNIYVRIEDDLLITNGEARVLSDCVPKTIQDIESLMGELTD